MATRWPITSNIHIQYYFWGAYLCPDVHIMQRLPRYLSRTLQRGIFRRFIPIACVVPQSTKKLTHRVNICACPLHLLLPFSAACCYHMIPKLPSYIIYNQIYRLLRVLQCNMCQNKNFLIASACRSDSFLVCWLRTLPANAAAVITRCRCNLFIFAPVISFLMRLFWRR